MIRKDALRRAGAPGRQPAERSVLPVCTRSKGEPRMLSFLRLLSSTGRGRARATRPHRCRLAVESLEDGRQWVLAIGQVRHRELSFY